MANGESSAAVPGLQKVCTTCRESFPLSAFGKIKRGKYGVDSTCRPCKSAYSKARPVDKEKAHAALKRYRERHRERLLAREKQARIDNPERARQHQLKYREKHREAYLARAREAMARTREASPEKDKIACAKYYAANKTKHRVAGQKWADANREKLRVLGQKKQARLRAAAPEKARQIAAEWRKNNPDKMAAYTHNRRALKLNAPGNGVTSAQWEEVVAGNVGLCTYCSQPKRLTMDHIEPLFYGGAHDVDNVVPACAHCNQSKNRRQLLYWLARRAA